MYYATEHILNQSILENRMCKLCSSAERYSNPDERKKLSASAIKRYSIKEELKKLSDAQIKRYSNPNERVKSSEAQVKRYINTEERNKTSEMVQLAMHRPETRKKHLDALHKSKWLKVKTDVGQIELLEKWNCLGFSFEPNYQIHTDSDLFYVDGYDKKRNVVLEYDSKYHNKLYQKQKDLIRQQKIIDVLKPKKFWRFDSINRQFTNVL